MARKPQNNTSSGEEAAASAPSGCPFIMNDRKPCGRPLYKLIHPGDEVNVCLMHTRDPGKDNAAFQDEFEHILNRAGAGVADFTGFVFPAADYNGKRFEAKCLFSEATFTQFADLSEATFTQDANFSIATFTQDADLRDATFTQVADFTGAAFTQDADFWAATFTQEASFSGAKFTQNAYFEGTTFGQVANFMHAKFFEAAEFSETWFRGYDKDKKARADDLIPGPVFSLAKFSQPEKVRFYKTHLGQALFHNCDVSKLVFSSVEWRQRKGSGKWMVLDEEVDTKGLWADALKPQKGSPDERDYSLIAELYQQLKKNYDDRKDYWTAGDFHYGEMEMKRLASRRRKPLLRWLHRNLGLVAWYKYASQYGESYLRPALWLLGVLLFFAGLYGLVGLQYDAGRDHAQTKPAVIVPTPQPAKPASNTSAVPSASVTVLTYSMPLRPGDDVHGSWRRARSRLVWHSLWASVFVALFQKELVYDPVYLWGRVFAVLEQALVSTLFALFILAVRRQFRR